MKAASKPTQPIIRVAAYLRVSTDEQRESGLGLEAQLEQVRAMAKVRQWPEPSIYQNAGVSGMVATEERPDGARLLADIAAGKIDALIVSSLSRIGHRAMYILTFMDSIKDRVQLVSCKEFIDTSTPAGKFMVVILAGLAEIESDTISERTKDALEARCRSVGIKAGRPPYGYFYVDDLVCIDEIKAAIVRRVYELREQGLTLHAITDSKEQETGKHIGFNTVKEILDREDVYRGESEQT